MRQGDRGWDGGQGAFYSCQKCLRRDGYLPPCRCTALLELNAEIPKCGANILPRLAAPMVHLDHEVAGNRLYLRP